MADVRSKNLYELLGNDPELDPNREPEPPTKAIDRPTARHGKRDAPKEPVTQAAPQANNRRGGRGPGGNEAAFRDRNAGRTNNRDKPTEDGPSQRRFPRGERRGNDRQSRASHTDTKKQVNQGWGAQSGNQEWDDERAAENIAKAEETEPQTPGEKTEEPADKAKSYADYLAEKAAQGDLSAKPVRAPNEGSQGDKKWAGAKELKHNEEEDNYIKGSTEKTKREKQRKEKNFLDVDLRYVEPAAPRGGGGPRGGRGGRGGGRGGPSGGRGRGGGGGGAPRGERGGAPISVDEKNFPSLGAK